MFGIDSTEFLLIVIVAVIVIGPKDLPRALYKVGQIVGKAQGMARHCFAQRRTIVGLCEPHQVEPVRQAVGGAVAATAADDD